MSNPVVLITGALTGIGRAAAVTFAKRARRWSLPVGVMRPARRSLRSCALSVRRHHQRRRPQGGCRPRSRFGRLDVAVNNAGTEGQVGPITDQTAESYAATFDTNVLGTLLSLKHELRIMQLQGSGSIINISSTMGVRGAANLALYTASKHAVEGLTKSAALETAPFGVRVNAVAPGPTETAMLDRLTGTPDKRAAFYASVPLKRGAKPEEIADAVVFLASDKASFITGQIIRINGGKTAT
jgi:NAD(P)-dependent dehydrogenase (short-subunit alcohol dehydrogenase family)